MKFTPRPYQAIAIDFYRKTRRGNLFADMGLGKTVSTLTAMKLADVQHGLIIAPLRVAQEVWPAEIEKWDHLRGMTYAVVTGTDEERRAALRRDVQLHIINYDNLLWLTAVLRRWPYDAVVADESTRLKGYRSQQGAKRAGALAQLAFANAKGRWLNLTGTPAPNGLQDLWGQQWFVDGGRALGASYRAFMDRWFYKKATAKNDRYSRVFALPHASAEIESRIASTTCAIRAADWFDVEAPMVIDRAVTLPPAARRQYRTMLRQLYADVQSGVVTAANAAVKTLKLQQMANGFVYHDDHRFDVLHDEKIEALRSIQMEAPGHPLLVVYEFVADAHRIKAAFKEAVEIRERDAVERWNAGQIPMLLAHPKSAGHGLNLQYGGHRVVYFGQGWDLELHLQVLERIGPVRQLQAGFHRLVYVYHIIARDTIDETIRAARGTKRSTMDALMDAMKRDNGA